MENYTATNHKIVVMVPSDEGIELHILTINLPVKDESEETPEQTPPGNVPSPPHGHYHGYYRAMSLYSSQAQSIGRGQTPSPQHYPGHHTSPQVHTPGMTGHQQLPGYTPVEVNTTYSHSVRVSHGVVTPIGRSDVLDSLNPIIISPIQFEIPVDVAAYVFANSNFSNHNADGEEEVSEEVHINPDISSVYLDAISHKYGFYDTLLALYYVEGGCDLEELPDVYKKSLHVNQNMGLGFILPFENALIAQRLAHSPHMSHMQHSVAKIILSVLERTKLNDGEMLLVNVNVDMDHNDTSNYTVFTELATLTKDMPISSLFEEALRIKIIQEGNGPRFDTMLMFRVLFGRSQYRPR